MPATMLTAPNRIKQPRMTTAPCRQLMRPVSIIRPTQATAMTATTVATVPNNVPCSHCAADTMGPAPCGSTNIRRKHKSNRKHQNLLIQRNKQNKFLDQIRPDLQRLQSSTASEFPELGFVYCEVRPKPLGLQRRKQPEIGKGGLILVLCS